MKQEDKVLKYLKTGRTLTPLEALYIIGTFSLPYHIFNLRKKGFNIATYLKQDVNGKRYAKYKLVSQDATT